MTNDITLVNGPFTPRLVVKTGGRIVKEVELKAGLSIGRAEESDLQLMDPKASRHHARVRREGVTYVLTDLGSANGTRVDGVRVTDPHALRHGERITIGDSELLYQEPGGPLEDTITAIGLPPAVQAATVIQAVEEVPSPPPSPPPAALLSRGLSRGMVIGLVVAAAVVLIAVVAIAISLLAPDVFEKIGLGSASPTPPVPVTSPTSPAAVGTAVETPQSPAETDTPVPGPVDPQEMNDLLIQAQALTWRSKFEDAIAIYRDLASRAPDDARPRAGWAWALILDDQAGEALDQALQAKELDATDADAAAVLARAYIETGDEAQALGLAEDAVRLDAGSATAHAILAEALMLNDEMQGAVDEADLALVQDINSAEAHRVRGWLYLVADNDLGRAASELQIAAGLQPELWLRRHELGLLLLDAEDYGTAIMALQDALGIRTKAVTYTAIGEAYYRLGQYDQARASLLQAIAMGAEDADTYGVLAATLARQGRCDDAKTYYEQALDIDPSHPLALEAKDLCEGGGAPPAPSPTTTSASQPTPASTARPRAQPTKPPASLSGRIAFAVWDTARGEYDTYVANPDGSGRSLVVKEMHQPAFSADGEWLAVNGERSNYEHLCVIRPDGSGLMEITAFFEDGQPNWSRAGHKLAFASNRHGDKQFRIYIVDGVPFGGGKVEGRTLNYGPDDVRGQMPAWTPDGRIVYRGCDLASARNQCNGLGLFIMSSEPGPHTPKQLTEHPEDTAPAAYGNQIAFMSNRAGNWEIYVMDNDGTGLKRLTNSAAHDGLPAWSPDGKTLAFVSNQGGAWAVWTMSPDGANPKKRFDIGGGPLPDWQQERISWGP
jgi:Tol biopolymer transport system component/Flp pilus assembly protein TadD